MKNRPGEKIKLASIDELLGVVNEESAMEIEINKIHAFKNHPFKVQGVILDAYGKMVVEECKKFDEKTKQKIHNYIQQQAPLNSVEQLKQDGQIRLEHYQKFYQNGTYERSRESGTEANYDMVDGLVNNQKRNQEKTFDARSNKQTSRNEQDNKPKKRRSVIKRLHQKQIAIARRSGKPIPKYLDQEMERKRG